MAGEGKLIGFGLLAVGGYWLLEQMGIVPCIFACPQTPAATTGAPGQPTGTSVGTTTNTNSNTIQTQTTLQQVIAKMHANGDDPTQNHSVYQYNYYYQQVTGVAGPDPSQILPGDPNASSHLININQWWAGMNSAGFSGFGLGRIASGYNPYANPMGRPFGNYAQLQGIERSIIKIN